MPQHPATASKLTASRSASGATYQRRLMTGPLLCVQASLHVSVCRCDEFAQSRAIDVAFGPELHVTHVLPRALQHARWIGELGATEEANIHMGSERIDI